MKEHYDIGLVGLYRSTNLGSAITYYSLYNVLNDLGYSILMIDMPIKSATGGQRYWDLHNEWFIKSPYPKENLARPYQTRAEMKELNQICDTFMVGSDQLFRHWHYTNMDRFVSLDWAESYKKKIAYAASFGQDTVYEDPEVQNDLAYWLSRYDHFSVREDSGVKICRERYGIEATHVLDPVFLVDTKRFDQLIENADCLLPEKYVGYYILDPNEEKSNIVQNIKERLGITATGFSESGANEKYLGAMNIHDPQNYKAEERLKVIKNCSFFVTDSFHGFCLASIFRKPVIGILNTGRGVTRFKSVAKMMGLENRLISSYSEFISISDNFFEGNKVKPIDWIAVEDRIKTEKEFSLNWLKDALVSPKAKINDVYDVLVKRIEPLENRDLSYNVFERRISQLEKSVQQAAELVVCKKELEDIRNSVSFKVGRSITFIPRKIRGLIRCYREHGLKYTVKRIKYKLLHLKDQKTSLPVQSEPKTSGVVASTAIAQPQRTQNKDVEILHSNPDFIKIRILATLLRDYGVKHIVLSPGGRDVPLVRMFEYNENQFVLHRVTDERSAAYYGMGIAAQLHQPVACVCTSGTAASNYLPAVTEAFYTGVPLIVITADRREIYLNHGEDQTIPQKNIYNGVVKKAFSIPEGSGFAAEYQTRRDISDCILETTHNGCGPVHINISIDNIAIGARVAREHWKLLPKIEPHIQRIGFNDEESRLAKWTEELKKSNRILVVYGQNAYPNEKQRRNIERFASKFNCVIITDFISNWDGAYSLKSHNLLQSISQSEFNEKLSPDILITVGGKRLMNDPITFKVRGGRKDIRHWCVAPDGKIKDFYFRLTTVIEMSQDNFFEWFADHAEDSINNGIYYNEWKCLADTAKINISDRFNAHYIQSQFIPLVPSNSLLHLGVGQSFIDSRRYSIDRTVEVFCNMGTNGIDGCTSTFMGQCAVAEDKLCFLLVGDLSFFYDMNSIWNKPLHKNIRILMVNNNGTVLLRNNNLKAITSVHNTEAKGWVESTGFEYISARSKEEFDKKLKYFISEKPQKAVFFEVICE